MMKKQMKIKEIESNIKIIREKSEDEIADITHDEPRVHETAGGEGETIRFGGSKLHVSPVLHNEGGGNEVRQDAVRAVQQGSVRNETREQSGAQLYAVGRGMGSEVAGQRANYRQQRQTAAATRIMQDNPGAQPIQPRGFVGGSQQGVGARNVMEENGGAVPERAYDTSNKKRERRVGPWE